MYLHSHTAFLQSNGILLGRILLGLLFFSSGVSMLMGGVGNTAGYFASLSIPMAGLVAWLVILVKIGAGGALMLGYKAQDAACLLLLFTLAATAVAHMNLEDMNLWKNLAIAGGLLYAMAYGNGNAWRI